MEVFFTSYAEGSLGTKASNIYHPMNQLLNERLGEYGDGLAHWFLMFVILSPKALGADKPERVLAKRKAKVLDTRLDIDFAAFKSADADGRQYLLYLSMLRSLDFLIDKDFADFDAHALRNDFVKIAHEEGWDHGDS